MEGRARALHGAPGDPTLLEDSSGDPVLTRRGLVTRRIPPTHRIHLPCHRWDFAHCGSPSSTTMKVCATVDLFSSSQLFLDRAIFTDYDVIFCDLMLPGISGIDLLFEVRGKAPAVPFVIISGQAAVSDAIEAMKAGATDFIVKPFRIQSLLDLVKRLTQDATPRMASDIWRREKEQNFAVGNSANWKSLLEKA